MLWQFDDEEPSTAGRVKRQHDLIGLKMEAAGIMKTLPTGVIRGVCDYGDGKVLQLQTEWLGKKHSNTIKSMASLAATYHQQDPSGEVEVSLQLA
jgi:hypothetical protein